ncbi:methyltransferase domain-containing protein [Mangrovibacter sp. SLW1]
MNMKISGGAKEDGIVFGNTYDKYGSSNPIVKWMMNGFESTLSGFVSQANPKSIHEVGCGEGFWVMRWNEEKGITTRGCDFSHEVIKIAQENAIGRGIDPSIFTPKSIYDLESGTDNADLVVCCEVLEHLEEPERSPGTTKDSD